MENKQTIFLHSMFRAGSTYMFNKFRSYEVFWPYYEPLHHDLIKLQKESLDIWKYDKKATNVMNHPELEKPHFYEFKFAFDSNASLPYYDTDFAYKEFFNVYKTNELKKYIDNLIKTAPDKKLPVLQFNRSSLRINWFKKQYPDSLNIFLLRNPRDQFESYYTRNPLAKNVFLAINIYIILNDIEATAYLLSEHKNIEFDSNVEEDINSCMEISKNLSLKKHYEIFYFIWMKSLSHAEEYANFIINMDRMNSDKEYIEEIQEKILNYTSESLNFNDYNLKRNIKYSMKKKDFYSIESKINTDLKCNVSTYNNYEYFKDLEETSKEEFFKKILSIFKTK